MAVKKPPVQYTKTRDGVRIAFCVAGDGPPLLRSTIVGATHTEYDWDIFFRVLPRLAEHFRVAWYDARGTGNSERTVTSFGFDEMMLDIDAVASVVGFHRFAVLGFASGASIALEYAARNPETVASLVVVDGAMAGPATMTRLNTARAMAELDWDVYTETMAKVLLAIDEPDYVRQLAEMYKATTTQDTYLRYYDESSNWHPRLDTIEQPTLVVNNRNLPWAPLEVSQEIAAGVRGARLVRIDR